MSDEKSWVGSASYLTNHNATCLVFTTGLSCGLLYFPSLSIVAQWFESRRALAVGLAICGSGVGTCLMALCVPSGVRAFSWRGLLIIFGAVFFQLAVGYFLSQTVLIETVFSMIRTEGNTKDAARLLSLIIGIMSLERFVI